MKKTKWPQRLRGTCKWGGVTLCVLLFAIWLASGWCFPLVTFGYPDDWLSLCWGGGSVDVFGPGFFNTHPQFMTVEIGLDDYGWRWWSWHFDGATPWQLETPGWCPILLLALPTGFLFWSDHRRRKRAGCCAQCGYSLTGNTSGACPECGAVAVG